MRIHFRQNVAENNKKLLQIPSNPHNIKLFLYIAEKLRKFRTI
jgi:hypothetical protein